MYKRRLTSQWANVVSDFAMEIKGEGVKTPPDRLNDWLKARAARFQSATAAEGIMLKQLNQPLFRDALLKKIAAFRLEGAPAAPGAKLWPGLLAGALLALGAGAGMVFGLKMNPVHILWDVALVFAVVLVEYRARQKANLQRAQAAARDAYREQAEALGRELSDLCDQFGVE